MSGSFTWNAIVRIGALKPYEKALVITVYHERDQWHDGPRAPAHAHWNTIVCFNAALRDRLQTALTAGDLVHFQGYVRQPPSPMKPKPPAAPWTWSSPALTFFKSTSRDRLRRVRPGNERLTKTWV